MHCGQQSARTEDVERNGDGDNSDTVPQIARTVTTTQVDWNHHAEHPALDAIAMQLQISPDGRRHQRQDHVIHAGSADLPYGFDLRQRNVGPCELLWPAVENVEPQPLS